MINKFFKSVFGKGDNNECYDRILLKAVLDSNKNQIERYNNIMSALINLQDALNLWT